MRIFIYTIATVLLVTSMAIAGYNQKMLSLGVYSYFKKALKSKNAMKMAQQFNPQKDVIFLPAVSGKDIFESVNDLSVFRRKSVREYIIKYTTYGKGWTARAINNSRKYLPIISKVHNEFPSVPQDMKLLPLLESAFNPFVVSRSGAVGLWQFMYATAKCLGLTMNRWVDERRNVEKSTRAAFRHLKNLYTVYKSWDLALAAYNGGGLQIRNGIKRIKNRNFWELRKAKVLAEETNEYLPKFAALLFIYKNKALFDIHTPSNRVNYLTSIEITGQNNLVYLSKAIGLTVNQLRQYNPELKGMLIPLYNNKYSLIVPKEILVIKQIGKYEFFNKSKMSITKK